MAELFGVLVGLAMCLSFLYGLMSGIWKTYAKAGKPGWTGIVPFYTNIVMARIAGKPVWVGVLCWVPYIGIFPYIFIVHGVAKKFGKGVGMTILLTLGVGWIILGWGSAQYRDERYGSSIQP